MGATAEPQNGLSTCYYDNNTLLWLYMKVLITHIAPHTDWDCSGLAMWPNISSESLHWPKALLAVPLTHLLHYSTIIDPKVLEISQAVHVLSSSN